MKLTALIADDEPLARSRMKRLLSQLDDIDVVAVAEDGAEAVELTCEKGPDLVFLDIEMPRVNGIGAARQILESATQVPAIIFCTAFSEFAVEAFETSAAAYLLKPVTPDQLRAAIERATVISKLQLTALEQATEGSALNKLLVQSDDTLSSVSIDDILYFRSMDKHILAGMKSGAETIVDYSLKELQERFCEQFVRAHRSALVNVKYLETLYKDEVGHYSLTLEYAQRVFPVSRRHLSEVRRRFGD